jgi:hypothetical protein
MDSFYETEADVRRTFADYISMGYSHNAAAYHAALWHDVSYDWVREAFRPWFAEQR